MRGRGRHIWPSALRTPRAALYAQPGSVAATDTESGALAFRVTTAVKQVFRSGDDFPVPLPAGIEAGDTLLLFLSVVPGISTNPPVTVGDFSVLRGGRLEPSTDAGYLAALSRVAVGGESEAIVSIVQSGTGYRLCATAVRIEGAGAVTVSSIANGTDRFPNPPQVTAGGAPALAIAVAGHRRTPEGYAPAPPSGYSDMVNLHTDASAGQLSVANLAASFRLLDTPGAEDPGPYQISDGGAFQRWVAMTALVSSA